MVRDAVERKFLSPEIVQAKGEVGEALLETERGLRAAQHMIRQHAGLDKPITAEPAARRVRIGGKMRMPIARVDAGQAAQGDGVVASGITAVDCAGDRSCPSAMTLGNCRVLGMCRATKPRAVTANGSPPFPHSAASDLRAPALSRLLFIVREADW